MKEIVKMERRISKEELQKSMPENKRKFVNDEMVDMINEINNSLEFHPGEFVQNFMTFTNVLMGTRYSVKQYVDAVKFCTYMLSGMTQIDAYKMTFPDIIERRRISGLSDKTNESAASNYNQNQIVRKILAQSQIPTRLIYGHAKAQAVEVLISKMTDPTAGHRINMESADKLLAHLKDPEENKFTFEHAVTEEAKDTIQQLREAVGMMSNAQSEKINAGLMSVKDIAESKIIEAEIE